MDVEIADAKGCPRYTGAVPDRPDRGAEPDPDAPAPWLLRDAPHLEPGRRDQLRAARNRPPLHAFDFDKLQGPIVVRRAGQGEGMETLDGQKRDLLPEDLLITDARGPVAIAGVMGGATSEVSDSTRQVLLEAATFDPPSIRRTAKRLGIPSEASYRFERGVDANGIPYASLRAAR
jgi:hypothetical protein